MFLLVPPCLLLLPQGIMMNRRPSPSTYNVSLNQASLPQNFNQIQKQAYPTLDQQNYIAPQARQHIYTKKTLTNNTILLVLYHLMGSKTKAY